jgi:GAF domain-containing protein
MHEGRLVGFLDLDSPVKGRFDEADLAGCVALVERIASRLG